MKYFVIMLSALMLVGATASAQDSTATEAPAAEAPPAEAPEEEQRSPYYKKVKGWLWLEGVAGPSAYDPDRYGSLSLGGAGPGGAPKLRGPQVGFSVGTGFGGGFFLGWYYRQANYSAYKLMKTGVEFQPTIRIPYVHIMFRIDLGYAKMFSGNAWALTDASTGGLDTTFGVGLRIPVVRWISIALNLDWSYIGLAVRSGGDKAWVSGQELAGTFALTFHFIGVRGD